MRWLLVVAAFALGGCEIRSGGYGPQQPSAHYAIVADTQGGVWKLDTQYGELEHCAFTSDALLHCVRQSH